MDELDQLTGVFPVAIVAAISVRDSLVKLLVQSKICSDGRTLSVELQHLPEAPLRLTSRVRLLRLTV